MSRRDVDGPRTPRVSCANLSLPLACPLVLMWLLMALSSSDWRDICACMFCNVERICSSASCIDGSRVPLCWSAMLPTSMCYRRRASGETKQRTPSQGQQAPLSCLSSLLSVCSPFCETVRHHRTISRLRTHVYLCLLLVTHPDRNTQNERKATQDNAKQRTQGKQHQSHKYNTSKPKTKNRYMYRYD